MKRNESMVCISCPMGCHLDVSIPKQGEWQVTGNLCKRGITYAENELTNPVRVLTTTVKINNGFLNRIPVRTTAPIPKPLLFDAMKVINLAVLIAPVEIGHVVVKNILGTGVDVVTSRSMSAAEMPMVHKMTS